MCVCVCVCLYAWNLIALLFSSTRDFHHFERERKRESGAAINVCNDKANDTIQCFCFCFIRKSARASERARESAKQSAAKRLQSATTTALADVESESQHSNYYVAFTFNNHLNMYIRNLLFCSFVSYNLSKLKNELHLLIFCVYTFSDWCVDVNVDVDLAEVMGLKVRSQRKNINADANAADAIPIMIIMMRMMRVFVDDKQKNMKNECWKSLRLSCCCCC